MAPSVYVPMTDQARDALIAVPVLWVAFAIVVGFRLVGRYKGAGIGVDDVLSLVACLLASTTIGMNTAVFLSGVGINFDPALDVYEKLLFNTPHIMQTTFAFTLIYIWTLACLKFSQLFLYWRVFYVQLRNWIIFGFALIGAWAMTFTFVFIFLCHPVKQQWSLQRIGKCMDQILVLKCIIMTNILTDIFIFVLPIRNVWRLQMRKTGKVAVLSCFALGAACVIIGIVRFWQIFVIDLTGNLTGTSLTTFMLCSIELMLAGLCISIPMLRPFYLQWRSKYKSPTSAGVQESKGATFKSSRSNHLAVNQENRGHMSWIELDHDNSRDEDEGSEGKLTREPSVIHVSKNWSVTSRGCIAGVPEKRWKQDGILRGL